jgi:predicted deacylase
MTDTSLASFGIEDVASGTKQRLRLRVLPGLLEPVALPVLVARGARPGPTLLAVAGVHGDEYEGMEALRVVFDELDPAQMAGAFVALPVCNPFAYEARIRISPVHIDGLNLARVFPGDPHGSPTRVLAHELFRFATRLLGAPDLFIDLHSGSADVAFLPTIGYRDIRNAAFARSEEAARHFGLDALWLIPDSPGTFNGEMARHGVTTLGTETTGRSGLLPDDVAAYVRGLRNLLAYLGILPDAPRPERTGTPPRRTQDLLAPATGFLRNARRLAEEVEAGDDLGTITDVFGEVVGELIAPISGTIWAARSMPAVRSGELVYAIAAR